MLITYCTYTILMKAELLVLFFLINGIVLQFALELENTAIFSQIKYVQIDTFSRI